MPFISKSSLPTQLLDTELIRYMRMVSFNGTPKNKPLVVSICIKLLVTKNVCQGRRGGRTRGPSEFAMFTLPNSNPEVVGVEVESYEHCQIDYQHEIGCMPQSVMEVDGLPHHLDFLCSSWLAPLDSSFFLRFY